MSLERSDHAPHRLSPVQATGFVLWRAGLILLASYSLYRTARLVLTHLELPLQLEIGAGLALSGAVLVGLSLVFERVQDSKAEAEYLR